MGMGYVPQDPIRSPSPGSDVQGRQRRGTSSNRDIDISDRSRQQRGRWGEDLAARWYRNEGFEVADRNWRITGGELDLVLRRDLLVVFCEVKTRATDAYGDPSLAVTWAKQRRIRHLSIEWLIRHDVRGVDIRFDVVAIVGVRVTVIEAAF